MVKPTTKKSVNPKRVLAKRRQRLKIVVDYLAKKTYSSVVQNIRTDQIKTYVEIGMINRKVYKFPFDVSEKTMKDFLLSPFTDYFPRDLLSIIGSYISAGTNLKHNTKSQTCYGKVPLYLTDINVIHDKNLIEQRVSLENYRNNIY